MIEILHDLLYQNLRKYGIIIFIGPCRSYNINNTTTTWGLSTSLATATAQELTSKQTDTETSKSYRNIAKILPEGLATNK